MESMETSECSEVDATFNQFQRSIVEAVTSQNLLVLQSIRNNELLRMKNSEGMTHLHSLLPLCHMEDERKAFLKVLDFAPDLCQEKTIQTSATPLCLAFKICASTDVITALIEADPRTVNVGDNDGLTPLHYVCTQKPEDTKTLVVVMIKHGADVNAKCSKNLTALNYFLDHIDQENITKETKEMLELLLMCGAKISDLDPKSIVKYLNKNIDLARIIIQRKAREINIVDANGWNLLHHIIVNPDSNAKLIKYLITMGAVVEDSFNPIPLFVNKECNMKIIHTYIDNLISKYNIHNTEHKVNFKRLLFLNATMEDLNCNAETSEYMVYIYNCKHVKSLLYRGENPFIGFPLNSSLLLCLVEKMVTLESTGYKSKFEEYLEALIMLLNIIQENFEQAGTFPALFANSFLQCYELIPKIYSMENEAKLRFIFRMFERYCPNSMTITGPCNMYPTKNLAYQTVIAEPIVLVLTSPFPRISVADMTSLMLDCGFRVNYPNNQVTALTALMHCRSYDGYKEEERTLVKRLIKKKVNVESMAINITDDVLNNTYESSYIENTKKIRLELKIPDAVLIAFLHNNEHIIDLLLPHWHAPPLALFIFHVRYTTRDFDFFKYDLQFLIQWFNKLKDYGGIPHGTSIYEKFMNSMQYTIDTYYTFNGEFRREFDADMQQISATLKTMSKTPLSLQELSKYVLRESVADIATREPEASLPDLLYNILPPLLRPVVLH